MSELDDIVKDFLIESYENLDELDRQFVKLETNPQDKPTLSSIFRTIHTIKGTCGFLNFRNLESVTHNGENLLSKLRDGVLPLRPEMTSALLAMVDAVRVMLKQIEETGTDGQNKYEDLIQTLKNLLIQNPSASKPLTPVVKTESQEVQAPVLEAVGVSNEPVISSTLNAPEIKPESVLEVQLSQSVEPIAVSHKEVQAPESEVAHVSVVSEKSKEAPAAPQAAAVNAKEKQNSVTDSTIRVDVGIVDKLMDLIGELVLIRNQLLQFKIIKEDTELSATSQRLNMITSELQENVMKTRMQPIGIVLSKFPRVVRDLALSCAKKIKVTLEGVETELDKTIIEAIKDPLTHLIRNSVDHGIEKPDARKEKGKNEEGHLLIRAYHESGLVNIEITDDGGGISVERVKSKALSQSLITKAQADAMSEKELCNLIFLPGFSTAEKVTNISGRGVGMDVVKTNIEKIGGVVDLQSKFGQGTTIKIKIPLTLAIIPALIITSNNARYAIPQVNLVELLKLDGEEAQKKIEMFHGAPVYRLRGKLLPLIYFKKLLGESGTADMRLDGSVNIVVLSSDDQLFGLVADGIDETQEIVVKPLCKQLKGLSLFAGATILGDGKVALIIDVVGLAQYAHVVRQVHQQQAKLVESSKADVRLTQKEMMLLIRNLDDGRLVVPLSLISRLEEFELDKIEFSRGYEVVQYRNMIMPLVRLDQLIPERRSVMRMEGAEAESKNQIEVVVYSYKDKYVGIIVHEILDVVEQEASAKPNANTRQGVLGSVVIHGRVTELLDIKNLLQPVIESFYGAQSQDNDLLESYNSVQSM